MRGKKGDRIIPPIIGQTLGRFGFVELENRQQFHRRYPQILQIGDLFNQAGVGSPFIRFDPGTWMIGKAFYMHFIDYGLGKRTFQRHVAFPIITIGIGNDTFHGAMVHCRRA